MMRTCALTDGVVRTGIIALTYGQVSVNAQPAVVEMCVDAGLVRGRELFFDSTKVEADAAVDSLTPRWFVEVHLDDLFEDNGDERAKEDKLEDEGPDSVDLLRRTSFQWKLRSHHVTGDGKYGSVENIAAVEEAGIHAYLGLHEAGGRRGFFLKSAFTYDGEKDFYLCPAGSHLRPLGDAEDRRSRGETVTYRARSSVCAACSLKPQCTTNKTGAPSDADPETST
jgi:hypothetical protein